MVNIKAIYKGQPMYGILDYFKVGKEYSFILYQNGGDWYLSNKDNKKQPHIFYNSIHYIEMNWEITNVNTNMFSEDELNLIYPEVIKFIKPYLRDSKINKILK